MDINSEATIRVAMNIESGAKEDIEAAYKAYRWEVISGSSVVVTRMEEEFVENQGFDAVYWWQLLQFRIIKPVIL